TGVARCDFTSDVFRPRGTLRPRVFGGRFLFLCAVRFASQNAFSQFSEPPLPNAGPAFRCRALRAAAVGGGGGVVFQNAVTLAGRENVYGAFVRQSGGTAVGHAGISAGLYI